MAIVTRATTRANHALGLAGFVGLSLLASACGGSSGAGVAQVGTTGGANGSRSASASSSASPSAYSACMRAHGVRNFPDPDSNGGIHAAGIDKGSRAFQAAYQSCRSLAPGGRLGEQARTQLQRQLLAFAACMRAHGVRTFPDPEITADGQRFLMGPHPIDPNSPTFTAAAAACRGKLSGDYGSRFVGKLLGGGKRGGK